MVKYFPSSGSRNSKEASNILTCFSNKPIGEWCLQNFSIAVEENETGKGGWVVKDYAFNSIGHFLSLLLLCFKEWILLFFLKK